MQMIRCSALQQINQHRQSVVDLSLVSWAAYRVVEPILSHTMVITERNLQKILKVHLYDSTKSSTRPIFRTGFVRKLVVPTELEDELEEEDEPDSDHEEDDELEEDEEDEDEDEPDSDHDEEDELDEEEDEEEDELP